MSDLEEWEAQLRLGRHALARGLIDGPALTRLLLERRASGAPLQTLLRARKLVTPEQLEALEAALAEIPPPPPAHKARPAKVQRRIGDIRCDVQLEKDRLTTLYVGQRPRDPKPVCTLVIARDALKKGLWMDFLETVRAARDVRSPHLEEILSVARVDEGFVVVTRFRQGTVSLRSLLDRVGRLKLSEVLRIALGYARGINALHEAGLVHRDATPVNVALTREGDVVVRNPGIAYEPAGIERVASPRTVYGTPHYMAPEVWRGTPPNPLSDVYAVGAALYEMASGVRPFEGESLEDLRRQHLDVPPIPPHEVLRDLPKEVSDLVVWALAKDPKDRMPAAKLVNIIRTLQGNIQRTGSTQRFEAHGG